MHQPLGFDRAKALELKTEVLPSPNCPHAGKYSTGSTDYRRAPGRAGDGLEPLEIAP